KILPGFFITHFSITNKSLHLNTYFSNYMNIHEYQGKSILKSFGVAIQEGIVAETAEQAVAAAKELKAKYNSDWVVIKAQIHAGGRGKGGGVKLAKNLDEVKERATAIIGMQLITPQTSAKGKKVNKVLVAQDVYYPGANPTKEFYMSVLLDRSKGQNVIMYSTEGGMDIEEVAHSTPIKSIRNGYSPADRSRHFRHVKLAFNLGLTGNAFKSCVKFVSNLYNAYVGLDCSMLEINPLFKTSDEKILAVDCKMNLDDNSLMRHPDLEGMRDISEEDPTEV